MKTNHLLLFVLFSCISMVTYSQIENFDLGKYVNPDYKRQQLDFNFNLNARNNNQEFSNSSYLSKSINSQVGGNFSAAYQNVANSLKLQQDWAFQMSGSTSDSKSDSKNNYSDGTPSNRNKNDYRSNLISIAFNSSDRFYHPNKKFIELSSNISYSAQSDKNSYTYWRADTLNSEQSYNDYGSSLLGTIGLRFGKGRIEYVQDARLALYILEDMQKHGRLTRSPSDDEILSFSQIITQVMNKRFFDTRIRKIEEIMKVDSFLHANNLISNTDATYFTLLNDNWDNAAGPVRMAGLRYSVGINPEYFRKVNNTSGTYVSPSPQNSDYYNYGFSTDIQLDHEKPLNLYWQLTHGIDLRYRFLKQDSKETDQADTHLNLNELSANLFIKLGFYPSSRTYWNATAGLTYITSKGKLKSDASTSSTSTGNLNFIEPYFALNGYYYISQRLRAQVNYSLQYNKAHFNGVSYYFGYENYPSDKEFNNSVNISLTYMLF